MPDDELVQALRIARSEIDDLQSRARLVSASFLKRVFAVLGHYLVASLIIAIPFYIVIFVIALVVGPLRRQQA